MTALNIMALYGSPRQGGNTEMLLDEFLKGAQGEGVTVDRLYVHGTAISPCRGCQACFQNGRCIITDDMEQIYPRLLAADIVVLASPIFFYGVAGGTKVLIDRAQALWGRSMCLTTLLSVRKERKEWDSLFPQAGPKVRRCLRDQF
jgi:multimeric flavodoxin WrbA